MWRLYLQCSMGCHGSILLGRVFVFEIYIEIEHGLISHNTFSQTLTSMVVIAGSSSLNQADASAQFIRIDSFTPHPDYQNTSKVNDIALVMVRH